MPDEKRPWLGGVTKLWAPPASELTLPKESSLNSAFTIADGQVAMITRRTKVAIVGASTLRGRTAPLDDPDWEVWALNAMVRTFTDFRGYLRADRYFELHPRSAQSEQDMAFFRVCPRPVYGLDDWKELKAPWGLAYPMRWVLDSFGFEPGKFGDFFACTFAYQIALAIALGFETIGLFGIDLDYGTPREMTVERASVAFWAAFAAGSGIEIVTHRATTLFTHPYRYGYDYLKEAEWTHAYLSRMSADGSVDPTMRAAPGDGAILERQDITDREWREYAWRPLDDGRYLRGQWKGASR